MSKEKEKLLREREAMRKELETANKALEMKYEDEVSFDFVSLIVRTISLTVKN